MDNNFINNIRNILPCIDTADLDIAIRHDNIYSPVEEHRYGVELSDDDRELYNKYTDYITTCISIFGELSNIEKCKKGDDKWLTIREVYKDLKNDMKSNENGGVAKKDNNYIKTWDFDGIFKEGHNKN